MLALTRDNQIHDNRSKLVHNGTTLVAQEPLLSPALLAADKPLTEDGILTTMRGRKDATDIISGQSDRLLVIVGPRYFDNLTNAHDYALALSHLNERFGGEICIMMRACMEKPGMDTNRNGLLNDPYGDLSFQLNKGLQVCREMLVHLNSLGIPVAYEIQGILSSHYFRDCMSTAFIDDSMAGLENFHNLGSSLPFPIGFVESSTNHGVVADTLKACAASHRFIGMTEQGFMALKQSSGNNAGFVILRSRGEKSGVDTERLQALNTSLVTRGQNSAIMVDCSHGEVKGNTDDQLSMAKSVNSLLRRGATSVHGAIVEFNMSEKGGQDQGSTLEHTIDCLEQLASGVRARREMTTL